MEGWIKLHRKIIDNWVFQRPDYFHAWITIIMTVNIEKNKILIHGEVIECDRGQSLLSLNSWTEKFGHGWTVQKTRTFFNLLKNDSMINMEGLRKTTRLTVCNYECYQGQQQTNNTQTTSKQHTANTQLTTIKEEEERKEENNKIAFETFWNLYDNKKDAKWCKAKWEKLSLEIQKKILEHVPLYKKSLGTFIHIKHPKTYLNGECWNDEIKLFDDYDSFTGERNGRYYKNGREINKDLYILHLRQNGNTI